MSFHRFSSVYCRWGGARGSLSGCSLYRRGNAGRGQE